MWSLPRAEAAACGCPIFAPGAVTPLLLTWLPPGDPLLLALRADAEDSEDEAYADKFARVARSGVGTAGLLAPGARVWVREAWDLVQYEVEDVGVTKGGAVKYHLQPVAAGGGGPKELAPAALFAGAVEQVAGAKRGRGRAVST
jgi:hypothetical protein